MRIAFADFTGWDFHAGSVDEMPMGGSQSAACYLARNLAEMGHDIFLITNVSKPGKYAGVTSLAWKNTGETELRALSLDVMVCVLTAGTGVRLRNILGPNVRLILWNQHAPDQAGVAALRDAAERDAYDGFAMVSDWQTSQYVQSFGLDTSRAKVLRNAIAPAFSNLFPDGAAILPAKAMPPILAYTSTPFRGLDLLLDAFPAIRKAMPAARLQVFSSMKVYHMPGDKEQAEYGALYDRCRQTEGVEYIGSLPQPELAKRLREVTVLAYPNSFPETSCIAVMEAMASGCRIVTSQLGALPETTAGFAQLIPPSASIEAWLGQFVDRTVQTLEECARDKDKVEAMLRAQVDKVTTADIWSVRAQEWIQWLSSLTQFIARPAGATLAQLFTLASQHHREGRLEQAEQYYRMVLTAQPANYEALHQMGILAQQVNRPDIALELVRQALAIKPNYAVAINSLGTILGDAGQLDQALAAHRQAIAIDPTFAEAYFNIGNDLKEKGEFDEAVAAYCKAIEFRPAYVEAYANLGVILQDKDLPEEAVAAYRKALEFNATIAGIHNNLGNALKDTGQLDEAIAAFEQAIRLSPDLADVHNNLGNVYREKGQLTEAVAAYRKAVELKPDYADAHSNVIQTMHYDPRSDAAAIVEEQRKWSDLHAEPLAKFIRPHANDRNPNRRLKIGYVSPDFRQHVVGQNLLPLVAHHDRAAFEITCYADVPVPDARTAEFQKHADQWRKTFGVSDERLAEQIREDQIDVLVDLSLHSARNRLLTFARKPAPVQVTFAGYPGSTGLKTIDYRLSDPHLDPPEGDESEYSEKTIRLPNSFWCYDPLENRDIAVNALPALQAGAIAFGCLNNFCKVNDEVLAAWGKVLAQVENSRLLLRAAPGRHRERVLERLGRENVDPSRIEFVPRLSPREYMKLYHRIDIGLDTFPYNGHTTSLDSLWMGVPFVTLAGETAVGRGGKSILTNMHLTKLIAKTTKGYIKAAVELASDAEKLAKLREDMRDRMLASPLMDAPAFARDVESAYRQMWRAWCAAK